MSRPHAEFTVARIAELIRQSHLLTDAQVQAIDERWQREADAADATGFTRWLVAQGYLTGYQLTQLIHEQVGALFLGPYELLDRIGQGDLATVYRAVHREGQAVALKVLPSSRGHDPLLRSRLHTEAERAGRWSHPNLVRTLGVDEAEGVTFLVLEYLPGEDLHAAIVRRGVLAIDDVIHVARQTLHGLQFLFEQGIVHGNLAPANLMLASPPGADASASPRSATIKILDTSLRRALFAESADASGLADADRLRGGPEYRAPEQARDVRCSDIRSDLYSVGCILYHALAGTPPFHGGSALDLVIRHAVEPPRPVREIRADVPAEVAQLVERLLAKDPEQRFATPAAAAAALPGGAGVASTPAARGVRVAAAAMPRAHRASVPTAAAATPKPVIQVAPPAIDVELVEGEVLTEVTPPPDVEPAVEMTEIVEEPTLIVALSPRAALPRAARSSYPPQIWLVLLAGALGLLLVQCFGWMLAHLL